jgi:hypothetical protein
VSDDLRSVAVVPHAHLSSHLLIFIAILLDVNVIIRGHRALSASP